MVLIGAGNTVFAKRLIGDVLLTPELAEDIQIALHDIVFFCSRNILLPA